MHADPSKSNRRRLTVLAAFAAAFVAAVAPATARADDGATCPTGRAAYGVTARALTGQTRTDLSLRVTAAAGCSAVTSLSRVTATWRTAPGAKETTRVFTNVSVSGGAATVTLDRLPHGVQVVADTLLQVGFPVRTYLVRSVTSALLRPDIVVRSVTAPLSTLTTRPVSVSADLAEVNHDVGADVHVVLLGTLGPLGEPIAATIPPGGTVSVTFPALSLPNAAPVELRVAVSDAVPAEYDTTNNDRSKTIEVTASELESTQLVTASLGGFGFQFNQHLYAQITSPPPESLPDLEAKVEALEPQMVRIFLNESWDLNADKKHPEWEANLASFEKTVRLAQESGATIVITWQSVATSKLAPTTWMKRFADELEHLVKDQGLTNVRWVNVGNEPNSTALTLPQYEAMVRALDGELRARGLRSQIGIIGGDLVQNTEGDAKGHRAWIEYMATHMNDVIDAWSEHIYWQYFDDFRMEERLKDVSYLVHSELPEAARKPVFIMEYGVRGYDTCGTKPKTNYGYYADAACTELRRMPLAGFQKLWFAVQAAQLGFDAVANWDLYWSRYDNSQNQSYWTIGPPEEGWPLYPSYYALRLLLQTTARGWQVLEVDPWLPDDAAARYDQITPDKPEQELAAFNGPDGQLTFIGLDTNGRALTAPDGTSSSYSIGGLRAFTTFTLVVWNGTGDGKNAVAGTVVSNAAGVVRFQVPLQAAFALTTVPVS